MKKQRTQILLLLLVLSIWGGIAYKIISHMNEDAEFDDVAVPSKREKLQDSIPDTFKISIARLNPFVSTIGNELDETDNNDNIDNNNGMAYIAPPMIDWPPLNYYGYIMNKNNPGKSKIMVTINNLDYLYQPGQEINGIKLMKVYKDSAIFSYKSENKTFRRNEN